MWISQSNIYKQEWQYFEDELRVKGEDQQPCIPVPAAYHKYGRSYKKQ